MGFELGFEKTISWEMGLGTPLHDPFEGLEKYVEGEGGEEFCKALNKIIAEEVLVMEPKHSLGKRYASTL